MLTIRSLFSGIFFVTKGYNMTLRVRHVPLKCDVYFCDLCQHLLGPILFVIVRIQFSIDVRPNVHNLIASMSFVTLTKDFNNPPFFFSVKRVVPVDAGHVLNFQRRIGRRLQKLSQVSFALQLVRILCPTCQTLNKIFPSISYITLFYIG